MALTDKLTAIADAIRAKTGGTAALTLDGMAEAVAGIEAGGGGVSFDGLTVLSGTFTPSADVSSGNYTVEVCDSVSAKKYYGYVAMLSGHPNYASVPHGIVASMAPYANFMGVGNKAGALVYAVSGGGLSTNTSTAGNLVGNSGSKLLITIPTASFILRAGVTYLWIVLHD